MIGLDYILTIMGAILLLTQVIVWVLYFKAVGKEKDHSDGLLIADLTGPAISYRIHTDYTSKELLNKKQVTLKMFIIEEEEYNGE